MNLSGAVTVASGQDYTLSFTVSGTAGRTLLAGIGESGGSYYNDVTEVTVNDGTQTIVLHVSATDATTGTDFAFESQRVIFDMGLSAGDLFIDDVTLTAGHTGTEFVGSYTAPDTPQAAEFVIDFNAEELAFEGAAIRNDEVDDNGTTREMLRIEKPVGAQPWAGVTIIDYGDTANDLVTSLDDAITMRANSSYDGIVTLKLEINGATNDAGFVEIEQNVTTGWNDLTFDLTGLTLTGGASIVDSDIVKAVVFPDLQVAAAGQVLTIDDLAFPNVSLIGDTATTKTYTFNAGDHVTAFEGGTVRFSDLDDNGTTREMIRFEKPTGAQNWAGVTIEDFGDSTNDLMSEAGSVTMRVYAEQVGQVQLKLEINGSTQTEGFVELVEDVAVGWNDVTFDFSGQTLAGGASIADSNIVKASIFGDLDAAAADQVYFIDDVTFASAIIA